MVMRLLPYTHAYQQRPSSGFLRIELTTTTILLKSLPVTRMMILKKKQKLFDRCRLHVVHRVKPKRWDHLALFVLHQLPPCLPQPLPWPQVPPHLPQHQPCVPPFDPQHLHLQQCQHQLQYLNLPPFLLLLPLIGLPMCLSTLFGIVEHLTHSNRCHPNHGAPIGPQRLDSTLEKSCPWSPRSSRRICLLWKEPLPLGCILAPHP